MTHKNRYYGGRTAKYKSKLRVFLRTIAPACVALLIWAIIMSSLLYKMTH